MPFASLYAQADQDQSAPAGGLEIAKLEGTLEALAGDRLKIKGADGAEYFIVLTPQTTLRYTGTADAKFLRPGLMVRFDATFDVQQGITIKPISEIEIFRPLNQRRMTREQRQNETPGIYPIRAADEEKDDAANARQQRAANRRQSQRGGRPRPGQQQAGQQDPVQQNAAQQNAAQQNATQQGAGQRTASGGANQPGVHLNSASQDFRVVGQLSVIQPTKLRVLAGNRPLIVDVDQDTQVTVAAGDAVFCLPGDQVQVTGLRNAAQANLVQAETVEIEGATPLGRQMPLNPAAGDNSEQAPAAGRGQPRQSARSGGDVSPSQGLLRGNNRRQDRTNRNP